MIDCRIYVHCIRDHESRLCGAKCLNDIRRNPTSVFLFEGCDYSNAATNCCDKCISYFQGLLYGSPLPITTEGTPLVPE